MLSAAGSIPCCSRAPKAQPASAKSGANKTITEVLTSSYWNSRCRWVNGTSQRSAASVCFCLAASVTLWTPPIVMLADERSQEGCLDLVVYRCEWHWQQGRDVNTGWFFIILFPTLRPPVRSVLCRPVCWYSTKRKWGARRTKKHNVGQRQPFFFGADFLVPPPPNMHSLSSSLDPTPDESLKKIPFLGQISQNTCLLAYLSQEWSFPLKCIFSKEMNIENRSRSKPLVYWCIY